MLSASSDSTGIGQHVAQILKSDMPSDKVCSGRSLTSAGFSESYRPDLSDDFLEKIFKETMPATPPYIVRQRSPYAYVCPHDIEQIRRSSSYLDEERVPYDAFDRHIGTPLVQRRNHVLEVKDAAISSRLSRYTGTLECPCFSKSATASLTVASNAMASMSVLGTMISYTPRFLERDDPMAHLFFDYFLEDPRRLPIVTHRSISSRVDECMLILRSILRMRPMRRTMRSMTQMNGARIYPTSLMTGSV